MPSNSDAYAAIRAVNASVTVRDEGRGERGRDAREGAIRRARANRRGSGWTTIERVMEDFVGKKC